MLENENYPNSDMEVSEKSARNSRILGVVILFVIFVWIFLEIRRNNSEKKMDDYTTESVPKYFLLYFNPESSTKILTDPDYCEKMKSIPDTLKGEREIYFIIKSNATPFYFDTVFGFSPICGDYKNLKYVEGIKEGDFVRFYDKRIGHACYFYSELTQDPAKTSRWYYNSFGTYKTLSEGIISCAGTSRVWEKKFDEMVAYGIVDVIQVKKMSSMEISIALYREYEYSNSGEIITPEQAWEEINDMGY